MRKTYVIKREICPRCKFNDKISEINRENIRSNNILDWFRQNTTYTKEQLENCTHYCDRCYIVFQVKKLGVCTN